jgi:hypothetical protein
VEGFEGTLGGGWVGGWFSGSGGQNLREVRLKIQKVRIVALKCQELGGVKVGGCISKLTIRGFGLLFEGLEHGMDQGLARPTMRG